VGGGGQGRKGGREGKEAGGRGGGLTLVLRGLAIPHRCTTLRINRAPPLGPPEGPRNSATEGSSRGALLLVSEVPL